MRPGASTPTRQSVHNRPEHDVERLPWIPPYCKSRSVDDEPVPQTTEIVEVVRVPRERISRVEQVSGSFEPLILEEIVMALLSNDRLSRRAPDPVQTVARTLKRDVGCPKIVDVPVPFLYAPLSILIAYYSCATLVDLIATQMENPFGDDVNDIPLVDFHDSFLDLCTEVHAGQKVFLATAAQRRRKLEGAACA